MRAEELTPELVRAAYLAGAFPMGDPETGGIAWYAPRLRALFPIEGVRVSRSLARSIRRGKFEVRFDSAFESVMRGCLRPRDNWITDEMICVYTEIHRQGWAHSAESWRDGELVGGVYGLCLGACFCAESMFHRETDASKVALWALVEKCREIGITLVDAQIMNPHLESLGAFEVPHEDYIRLLQLAHSVRTEWDGRTWA